jgi:hypothetical protein
MMYEKRPDDATEAVSNMEWIRAMNIYRSAINLSQNHKNKAAQIYLIEKKNVLTIPINRTSWRWGYPVMILAWRN